MALTALAIKSAKSRTKPYKLADSDGLYLLVTPSGGRCWRMNYRHLGKQKTLAFGTWPDTSLADARERRDAARKVLARGDDPAEQIKLERIAATVAASNSFKAVADEWLTKAEKEGRSAVTMKKLRWLLDFINESIGKRPIASISAQELLIMLRKMEGKGKYETAKRLRSTCSQVFRYAIATARAERDVAADLRGALIAPKPVHRAAITGSKEAGGLLRAIEAFEGHPNTKAALRLLPHVFVRPGELRHAEWSDFDFDKALWTIPPHKTKMRRAHTIPLPALGRSADVGEHDQRGAAPHGLHSGRDDRPRLPGNGGDTLERDGSMAPRRDRAPTRPLRQQRRPSSLRARRVLG